MNITSSNSKLSKVNNNNNEAESSPQNNNNSRGVARFYDCVFCKMGFTTAQALGGHMNIHRKDRGKIRHRNSSKKAGEEEDAPNYATFFPVSPLGSRDLCGGAYNGYGESSRRQPRELSHSGGAQLQFRHSEEDNEPDLELRLGHA